MATDGPHEPPDAFAAVGNEWRIRILRALDDAAAMESGLAFSDIYDCLDIESTSQLSYHLTHLEGVFVRKTDDGYALTQAGDRLVRAVLAGTYTESPSFPPTELDANCPACPSNALVAEFREPFLTVECTDCSTRVVTYDLPPAASRDGSPRDVLRSCDRRVRNEYAMAVQGDCPVCGGPTTIETPVRDGPLGRTVYAEAACSQCEHQVHAPLGVRLLSHPAVISFYWTRGVDATAIPFWDLHSHLADWETDVVDDDPRRFRVTVAYDGDTLPVELDERLRVSLPDDGPSGYDD
jgi:DNA-binding HxlR family transcriptional regulator